jgi:4-amino-4-deoxy-L-arabinose transferase-like glycosyltransferase
MANRVRSHLADRGLCAIFLLSLVVLMVAYHAGLPSATFINVGDPSDQRSVHNFYDREQGVFPFRWTKDSSTITLPELACVPATIRLTAAAARPQGEPLPTLTIFADSQTLAHFVVQNDIQVYELAYSPPTLTCLLPRDLLLFLTSDTFDPPGQDSRSLGVLLNTVEVAPTPPPLSLHAMSLPASLILCLSGTLSLCLCYLLFRHINLSIRLSALSCLGPLALVTITLARRAIPPTPTFASLALLPIIGVALGFTLQSLHRWDRILGRLKAADEHLHAVRFRRVITSGLWPILKARARRIPIHWWLLLALYLATRLTNLTALPVFTDEAIHISEAQRLDLAEDPLSPLQTRSPKPVLDWITKCSLSLSSDPLVSARIASVVVGALGMLGLYLLGSDLYSTHVGALAAALYVISPLMLFHDRMVLADVMLNTCGLYVLLFSLRSLQKGRATHAVALGATMALAVLSKLPGVFFLVAPLLVWALVRRIKITTLALRLLPAYCTTALFLAPVLLHSLGPRLFNEIGLKTIATSQALTFPEWASLVAANAATSLTGIGAYLTFPVGVMYGVSLALVLVLRNEQGALLWTTTAIPVAVLLGSSTGFLPPRYFLFAVSPILACVAWSIEQLSRAAPRLLRRAGLLCDQPARLAPSAPAICISLLAVLSLQAASFDYFVLTDPSRAPLPSLDRWQYVQGWPSGYGMADAVNWLEDRATQGQLQVITDLEDGIPLDALLIYLRDNPRITIRGEDLAAPLPPTTPSTQTFVVVDAAHCTRFPLLNPTAGLVATYPKPGARDSIDIYALPAQEESSPVLEMPTHDG